MTTEIVGVVGGRTKLCLDMVLTEEAVDRDHSCASVNILDMADMVFGIEAFGRSD